MFGAYDALVGVIVLDFGVGVVVYLAVILFVCPGAILVLYVSLVCVGMAWVEGLSCCFGEFGVGFVMVVV